MMENLFQAEILREILLTFLYLVPVSFFRYAPFTKKFRFSIKLTVVLYFLFFMTGNVILVLFGKYDSFTVANRYRLVLYFTMTLFSLFLVRENIGKQLYVICFYGNYSLLFSAATLIVEILLFGRNSFHLTFKVVGMAIVQLLALPLIYHFSFLPLSAVVKRRIPKIWNILWLAGLVQLLLNAALSIPYQTTDIWNERNALVRLSISMGSILLNHTILYLIKGMLDASDENMALEAEKQQLIVQDYQYRILQKQVEQSRRFRHDFKHHSGLISAIAGDTSLSDSEKLNKLTDYCREYFGSVPTSEEQHFCDNYPLNLILNYYAEKAQEHDCSFHAKINVPSQMAIPDLQLCVIIGNLLMNAIEGAVSAPKNSRQILLNITKNGANLLILVENSFDGQLNRSGDIFHSTRHPGEGIGIQSIRSIASKYHGTCYFDSQDKVFSARIHMYLEY